MKLSEHLEKFGLSMSPADLEVRMQAAHKAFPSSPLDRTWKRIKRAMETRGEELRALSPAGRFVPHIGPRRKMSLCGQTYSIGYGGNSTGERYAWHYAEEWAVGVLVEGGMPEETARRIWSWCRRYPHRALEIAEEWYEKQKGDRQEGHEMQFTDESYEAAMGSVELIPCCKYPKELQIGPAKQNHFPGCKELN